MTELPPFKAAQEAYRAGQPCNPPADLQHEETYPDAQQMWLDGWRVAQAQDDFNRQIKMRLDALDLLSDGKPRTKSEIFAKVGEISREHWRRMIVRGHVLAERISAGDSRIWIYRLPEEKLATAKNTL